MEDNKRVKPPLPPPIPPPIPPPPAEEQNALDRRPSPIPPPLPAPPPPITSSSSQIDHRDPRERVSPLPLSLVKVKEIEEGTPELRREVTRAHSVDSKHKKKRSKSGNFSAKETEKMKQQFDLLDEKEKKKKKKEDKSASATSLGDYPPGPPCTMSSDQVTDLNRKKRHLSSRSTIQHKNTSKIQVSKLSGTDKTRSPVDRKHSEAEKKEKKPKAPNSDRGERREERCEEKSEEKQRRLAKRKMKSQSAMYGPDNMNRMPSFHLIPSARVGGSVITKGKPEKEEEKSPREGAKFEIDQEVFAQLDSRSRNRLRVIREIFETEQEYANDLDIIIDHFLLPIGDKNLLSLTDQDAVFSCVRIIRGITLEMLDKLTALLSQDDGARKIGEFFLSVANMIKVYGAYVGNQDKALATVEKYQKKSKPFAVYLSNMMENPICRGLPLTAFLIKPTQRVCKYPLLLRELLKSTDEQSEEFETLKRALQGMEQTTSAVNERKRELEAQSNLLQIAQSLQGYQYKLMVPGRVLVKEGLCEKVNVHGKAQVRKFWLFNDLVVYAAPSPVSSYSFIFKDTIPINVCIASPIADQKETLQLTRLDKKKKYLVKTSSEEERNRWVEAIMLQNSLARKSQ